MVSTKERLINKYEKASDALESLKESYVDLEQVDSLTQCTHKDRNKTYRTYRDSMIQRFEYTFDTTWKYIGEYLESQGRIIEVKTPKAIFRECLKAKVITESETRLALAMVDHRNLTTHGYDEELVEKISKHIPDYIALLQNLLNRTRE